MSAVQSPNELLEAEAFNQAVEMVSKLSPLAQMKIIQKVIENLEATVMETDSTPRKNWYGFLADLGSAPSTDDIDETRREMWANFPREDI